MAVIQAAGATAGPLFGRFSDRELYGAIISRNADLFIELAGEIADILHREAADYVVGDAVEGFNPCHDLCRLLINTAVTRIENKSGRRLHNFEFLLEGAPDTCPPQDRTKAIFLQLGDDAYRRK